MENVGAENAPSRRDDVPSTASATFGRKVRELRIAAGLTQQQLAERLSRAGRSYHQTTVAKLEKGTRPTTLDELAPLASALGVSQADFFGEPSPEELAARHAREAEQRLLQLRSTIELLQTRFTQLRGEFTRELDVYTRRTSALARLDPVQGLDRAPRIEEFESFLAGLTDISPEALADARAAREELQDLIDTVRGEIL